MAFLINTYRGESYMDFLKVKGGRKLDGRVKITSAKNAVLPIIACSILTDEDVFIKNCASLSDISSMLKIINNIGGKAEYTDGGIRINCADANPKLVGAELTGGIRSSIFILGPVLSRFRHAEISYPGGCEIGLRPIDLHIYGLKRLKVNITEENGLIVCDGKNLSAGEVDLDFPSVGATENIMMAAVLAKGNTVIRNAAREPEIIDLAGFINAMGGKITGAGSDTVYIEGVKKLRGGVYTPITDRIVGATYMAACAVAGGDIVLDNFRADYIHSVTEKLIRCGAVIDKGDNFIRVRSDGRVKAVHKIETQPYPGFPTDMQPQMAAVLAAADGCSVMVENLFESRFKYTVQLNKMGAKITVKDRIAIIKGVKKLLGTSLCSEDLRGGASLVLAALKAEGESLISGIHHIDRGYYKIEEDFKALGADIERISAIKL